MKIRVKYTASFYAAIEVPDDATLRMIGDAVGNRNIIVPEDEVSTYAEDSFEPDADDNGDPLIFNADNEPITLAEAKEEAAVQSARDEKRCGD